MTEHYPHKKTALVTTLILLAILGGCVYRGCKPVWQFDHLEQHAKRVITGDELQTWATNLLARYPQETEFSLSDPRAPQQLRGYAPMLHPDVYVHIYDDTNQPPYVQVAWGSGFLGHAGFYIGSTNFVISGEHIHVWQPGVYFYGSP
jgi:hypothetical protein